MVSALALLGGFILYTIPKFKFEEMQKGNFAGAGGQRSPVRRRAFERPGLTEDEIEEIREAFALFDTDNSGAITLLELKAMLAKLGVQAPDEQVIAIMREMDENKNGVITFTHTCTKCG